MRGKLRGLGPAKEARLREAGIRDLVALAEVDLRRFTVPKGISKASMKTWKSQARGYLDRRDVPYGARRRAFEREQAEEEMMRVIRAHLPAFRPRRSLLARIMGR